MTKDQGDAIVRLLTEMVSWLRLENRAALRASLAGILRTENDRAVYELTDGTRTQTAISNELGTISVRGVGQKWEAWLDARVVYQPADSRHLKHLSSLAALGELPET